MYKMYQYRLFPTKKQVHKLNETLNECRWLYNHFLEKRKTTYEQEGQSLSCYNQIDTLGLLKQERPAAIALDRRGLAQSPRADSEQRRDS